MPQQAEGTQQISGVSRSGYSFIFYDTPHFRPFYVEYTFLSERHKPCHARRRIDLVLPISSGIANRPYALDVTVAAPFVLRHLPLSRKKVGAAAINAELPKFQTYRSLVEEKRMELHPIGIDSYGAPGKYGQRIIPFIAS